VKEESEKMKKSWLAVGIALVLMLVGCGGTKKDAQDYKNDVSTKDLIGAVAEELGEDYWPDADLTAELLNEWYGVADTMYEEFSGQTPMISTNVDTLIIVKATDDHVEDVKNALNTYREAMVQDTMQYPMNLPKIQASEVQTFGNYICFVQLGADINESLQDDEAAVKQCQEMNKKALAVIEKGLTK